MIAYILKSSLSLLLLFGLYWFILRKEKLFTFNRYFLLFSIILSIIIPFISIPVDILGNNVQSNVITALNSNLSVFNTGQNISNDISYLPITEDQTTEEMHPSIISFSKILLFLYISGVILLVSRFMRNIYLISKQIRLSENVIYSGRRLVLIEDLINPYCFYKTIFVNKHDYLNRKIGTEILAHELEHIKQSHSIDILFLELVRIVYWFNPILILYSRAIRVNHEYMADNGVVRDSLDIKSYADKLLSFISCKRNIPLTSGFNHALTKRRLLMITKPKSKSAIYGLRITLTLCMILVFFLFFSFKPSNAQPIISLTNHKDATDTLLFDEDSLTTGKTILKLTTQSSNVIDKKVKYTSSGYIKQDTINQMIVLVDNAIVSFGEITIKADSIVFNRRTNQIYAIGRQGSSGTIIGKPILKEGSQEMEADEIIYNLNTRKATVKNIVTHENIVPKDSGSINKDSTHNQIDKSNNDALNPIGNEDMLTLPENEKLIIVDGVVYTKKPDDIPIESIQNFRVLGNFEAANKYGEKGRNGVILITTKGKTSVHTDIKTLETQNTGPQVNAGGVVAATNMNVLYLGIPNPVEIAVPGVTSDKVTATLTNGIISKTTTGWEVNPSSLNDLVLTILVNNKKVNEKIFRVKPIPAPVAVFAGKSTGSESKEDVLRACTLETELKDFPWDLKFEIESFTFLFSSDGSERDILSKGNMLTDEMKSLISDLKSGQNIIFKDIKAIGPDGKHYDLNPVILKID